MSAFRSVVRRLTPRAEELGIQPVPKAGRTGSWLDLFAINIAFGINPLYFIFGAIGVIVFDLPLWWAVIALTVGQTVAYTVLALVAHMGADDGVPGQVGMRAFLGYRGASISSAYRTIAALYWFATQAITTAYALQALAVPLAGWHLRVVPTALVLAAVQGLLAVLGFDVLRYATKVILPLGLAFLAVILALYMASDRPAFAVGHVFASNGHHLQWTHFWAYVTLVVGSQLTFLPSIADFSRYTRSRRDSDIGLHGSAFVNAIVVTFIGGFGAVAVNATRSPFDIATTLTSSKAILAFLALAVVVQSLGVNVINAYSAGMSIANIVPRLGRLVATAIGAAAGIALSSFPDFLNSAADWIGHLGNLASPMAGVVLVDYLWLQRQRVDVAALYDPRGRYRYLGGFNVAAVVAIAAGVAVYYSVPQMLIRFAWAGGVAALLYAVLERLQRRVPALAGGSASR